MSTHFNSIFNAYTQGFIQQNFMTAARISMRGGVPAGWPRFDLQHHMIDRCQFVTLDVWAAPPACDEIPLMSFWAPQGGSCLVPVHPVMQSYVFTADFNGCSILVDQVDANWYRVYHVQGGDGHLQQEYLARQHLHGLGLAGAMTFYDYGTIDNPCSFAFLKYENGRWQIHYQHQNSVIFGNIKGHLTWLGAAPTVLGVGSLPVADLTHENPQIHKRHDTTDLLIGHPA